MLEQQAYQLQQLSGKLTEKGWEVGRLQHCAAEAEATRELCQRLTADLDATQHQLWQLQARVWLDVLHADWLAQLCVVKAALHCECIRCWDSWHDACGLYVTYCDEVIAAVCPTPQRQQESLPLTLCWRTALVAAPHHGKELHCQ